MSFDTLITIAVIIYIIVSIRKAFKAGKKGNTPAPASGWKGKIQDFVNEIKDEIEKANRESQTAATAETQPHENDFRDEIRQDEPEEKVAPPSFWDEVNEKKQSQEKSPAEVINQTLFYETNQERQPPPLQNVQEEGPEESHRNIRKSGQETGSTAQCKQKKAQKTLCLDKESLKKAIVWSEILAPPVGLRD